MIPSIIKDRHYRKARRLCEKHVKEVRSPELVQDPMLSVLFVTYNHARFVRQALESVLMQKASFPFEIVISDDCSTDGTRQIVQEYYEKHPDKIRLLLSNKNLWNFRGNGTGSAIALAVYEAGHRSKYNAILEGDDYWTRSDKLDVLVGELEKDQKAAMAFHNYVKLNENTGIVENSSLDATKDVESDQLMILGGRLVISYVYRSFHYESFLRCLYRYNITGDRLLVNFIGRLGYAKHIRSLGVAAVYRMHASGTHSSLNKNDKLRRNINTLHSLYSILNNDGYSETSKKIGREFEKKALNYLSQLKSKYLIDKFYIYLAHYYITYRQWICLKNLLIMYMSNMKTKIVTKKSINKKS